MSMQAPAPRGCPVDFGCKAHIDANPVRELRWYSPVGEERPRLKPWCEQETCVFGVEAAEEVTISSVSGKIGALSEPEVSQE